MTEIGVKKSDLDTPVLWVELDRLSRNIAYMAEHCRQVGIQWRPHTKGIKTPALAHQLLAAGAIGITCAKLGEAEAMVSAGITDILVANQIVGPHKITRLVNLQRQADVKVAVDNAENVRAIGAAAHARGVTVGLLLELDTGMNRAGVAPGEAALQLAQLVHETPGVQLRGLMTWEGHTITLPPTDKQASIEHSIGQLLDTAEQCRRLGLPIDILSCGGSGTYQITTTIAGITEIQAGGGIYGDVTYQGWGVPTEPALFVQSMVTSRPAPDRVIIDAGFKTLPRGFATPKVVGLPGIKSVVFSAEHGIITLEAPNESLRIGDVLDLVVGYSDATVCLHDQLYGIRDGVVEAVWPILGRGKLR